MLQRRDEISSSVNAVKTERKSGMAYAEIKAHKRAKGFNNGESAAEPRIEEGSTTMYGAPEMVKI